MQPVRVERRVLETHVEKRLVAGVKKLGGRSYKWQSQNHRGVADRVAVLPGGVVWFIELKRESGRLSPLQKKFQQDMQQLHMNRYVVLTGFNEVDAWLREQESYL